MRRKVITGNSGREVEDKAEDGDKDDEGDEAQNEEEGERGGWGGIREKNIMNKINGSGKGELESN